MGWLYECFSAQALEYECLWMCDGESYEMTVSQYELVLHKDSNWKIVG